MYFIKVIYIRYIPNAIYIYERKNVSTKKTLGRYI